MRLLLPLALLGLVGLAGTAGAAGGTRAEYVVGGVAGVLHGGAAAQGQATGVIVVPTGRRDRHVTVTLADQSGRMAAAEVAQDLNGDGEGDQDLGTACGRAKLRLVAPGRPVVVYPVVATCGSELALTTTGVLTVVTSPR